ncbi:hypothetical protein LUI11_09555 [Bradyrhizobium diazoefficiens]|uniref:hypothetical protein n=1 Tax=Bradyrhizobium TaxID=374 RepID=UPI0004875E55|nr:MULTISPECIES: hypothetical protein [Bradyrhizobium]APO54848.1 hypothetical protein BD122_31240 [Bradyrhizobium diazoefficiens]KOY10062.1 hypothetical protein AF336_11770 [Bradyrhizobium diazoefficiens]MCD9292493.1 hypothetical protein [Bradyrhizobium diazoefficiens]MCD9811300.1 hypothetical protein [Bradyrhizobium diazoefficiens]MCD9829164.1 hypothetical protein [Bradyrhizobium diazoefficiens]
MRSVTLLALGLMLVGAWSYDSARGQTSLAPPVSLAPPKESPPRASAKNSPAASDRVSSTPATGGLPQSPNPAADYDGFSAVDDNDTPEQATRPMTSRAAKGSKPNPDTAQQSIDQEDEALKRKLTICKSCK